MHKCICGAHIQHMRLFSHFHESQICYAHSGRSNICILCNQKHSTHISIYDNTVHGLRFRFDSRLSCQSDSNHLTKLLFFVEKKIFFGRKQNCSNLPPRGLHDRSPTSPGPLLRFLESSCKIGIRKKKKKSENCSNCLTSHLPSPTIEVGRVLKSGGPAA